MGDKELRDRFAEVAMEAILKSGTISPLTQPDWINDVARLAYQVADAMMQSRVQAPAPH